MSCYLPSPCWSLGEEREQQPVCRRLLGRQLPEVGAVCLLMSEKSNGCWRVEEMSWCYRTAVGRKIDRMLVSAGRKSGRESEMGRNRETHERRKIDWMSGCSVLHIQVEKLKDLCLNQRQEIKALKDAVLFPDEENSQLHELFDKQGSELKQAKLVIPALQRQVTSLTGQLQSLAEDLAEVKADKYAGRGFFGGRISSPQSPQYDQEAANSLEFSSGDPVTPGGSPDDLFLKDLNPLLTPCNSKAKSKEYEEKSYDSSCDNSSFGSCHQASSSSGRKMSRSSEYCQGPSLGSSSTCRLARKSDENKFSFRKPINQKRFPF